MWGAGGYVAQTVVRRSVAISEICVRTIFIRRPVQFSSVQSNRVQDGGRALDSPLVSKIATLLINCACRISCSCARKGTDRERGGALCLAYVYVAVSPNTLQFVYCKWGKQMRGIWWNVMLSRTLVKAFYQHLLYKNNIKFLHIR